MRKLKTNFANFYSTPLYGQRIVAALRKLQTGILEIILPDGEKLICKGRKQGVKANINFLKPESLSRIARSWDIGLGEGYMLGLWDTSNLKNLMRLMADNCDAFATSINKASFYKKFYAIKKIFCANTCRGSRNNIHLHYDLSNDFYSLWLDKTMTYSGALFKGDPAKTLEEAQYTKYKRILDILAPSLGDHILEIGCGWGGFMEQAAKNDFRVTGITISKKQQEYIKARFKKSGFQDLVNVRFQDYRDVREQYDYVVSIGMFEHVGEAFWPIYMKKIHDVLRPGGKAMIQSIIIRDDLFQNYRRNSDFIREHIFLGGMLPSPLRFQTEALKAQLEIVDVFHFGKDYAITLEKWLERFDNQVNAVRSMGYNEEFIRKWRFYLAGSAALFRAGRTDLMQVELCRSG